MKIIVSSKVLGEALNKVGFSQNYVSQIFQTKEDHLTFKICNGEEIELYCHCPFEKVIVLDQDNRRWDWVRNTCVQIDEQPIAIDITEKKIEIKLQY
jgi:hypothetical protein